MFAILIFPLAIFWAVLYFANIDVLPEPYSVSSAIPDNGFAACSLILLFGLGKVLLRTNWRLYGWVF